MVSREKKKTAHKSNSNIQSGKIRLNFLILSILCRIPLFFFWDKRMLV